VVNRDLSLNKLTPDLFDLIIINVVNSFARPPLPPLQCRDSSFRQMKTKPVSENVTVDEKGRRRFHGAFTGGFSAGYYNTVGSAEGWKPATFVSSRYCMVNLKSASFFLNILFLIIPE
jgi:hypothetical protein